ncbi:DUF805 domain-containing protein [Agarivorans sp.]|uniref:DUF805 domain-containing protein n=1 Tax=Agarivorans sp. TaxID=1872412 RepID=UPI003D093572
MNWYIAVLKKYVVFNGRARRKEYWMFTLFSLIITFLLAVIDAAVGSAGILGAIYALAVFLPTLAVSVRRLHDIGRSGWWLLIAFIPLIGAIVLLVFMLLDSKPGSNDHGEYPKEVFA